MGNIVIVDGHKWEEIEDGIYKSVDQFTTTEQELCASDNYSEFNVVGDIVEGTLFKQIFRQDMVLLCKTNKQMYDYCVKTALLVHRTCQQMNT